MVVKTEEENGKIESVFGLWRGRGKVAFSCHVSEEIVIPAGAKILAFQNETANDSNRRPHLSICYVLEQKN